MQGRQLDRHLVNKSAGLLVVSTFRVWTVPLATSFWIHKYCTSMCLVLPRPCLCAIPRAADASDEMRASASKPRSRKIEHKPFACAHLFTMGVRFSFTARQSNDLLRCTPRLQRVHSNLQYASTCGLAIFAISCPITVAESINNTWEVLPSEHLHHPWLAHKVSSHSLEQHPI